MKNEQARIISISRHRISIDGDGVTTLVAFHQCPLHCHYCLNPISLGSAKQFHNYSPEELYIETRVDELYFLATNGGVTFGGGEPCIRTQFIHKFRELCGNKWKINIETSLNIPTDNVKALLPITNTWIIDIKDMNTKIYNNYTGKNNDFVINNLKLIVEQKRQKDCIIRLPLIPNFNTDKDRMSSMTILKEQGFSRFDLFTYKIQ